MIELELVLLNWFSHFLQVYEKDSKYGIKMLLDNKTNLLSKICSNISTRRMYGEFPDPPTTFYSLKLLILILKMLYIEKELKKKDLLDFLFSTYFILEHSSFSSILSPYVYLFNEILQEYDLMKFLLECIRQKLHASFGKIQVVF
ncbi:MAG: hypothetical protein ACRCSV_04725 [Chlamydiales bacterium]